MLTKILEMYILLNKIMKKQNNITKMQLNLIQKILYYGQV
jgi:hypothetical protein